MKSPILLLPGIGNSGPEHWQTLWENADAGIQRIGAQDWENPECSQWVTSLECAVNRAGPDVVLVAHSLGCLQIAHWAAASQTPIRGALLVAVPDPDRPSFPKAAVGFGSPTLRRFGFPSIVVASTNDPFAETDYSERCAQAWGSVLVNIGACGHINAQSGLGDWPRGKALLESFLSAPAI
ncbi:alpha/beta fold hydrolase [Pseudomonas sp. PNP]|uniref:RBBP9/YdeN family alpha/beta hydrolase n=1 Tax=Pseudomonas sp. PNP TaxID=361819 RepID=UPI0032B2ECEE